MVEKVLLMRKNLVSVLFRRPTYHSSPLSLACDGINVYMNLDDTLKNETLMFDV